MTNEQIVAIYQANISESFISALRGLYNAGYYEGAGITPTAASVDQSRVKSKPVAVVRTRVDEKG